VKAPQYRMVHPGQIPVGYNPKKWHLQCKRWWGWKTVGKTEDWPEARAWMDKHALTEVLIPFVTHY